VIYQSSQKAKKLRLIPNLQHQPQEIESKESIKAPKPPKKWTWYLNSYQDLLKDLFPVDLNNQRLIPNKEDHLSILLSK